MNFFLPYYRSEIPTHNGRSLLQVHYYSLSMASHSYTYLLSNEIVLLLCRIQPRLLMSHGLLWVLFSQYPLLMCFLFVVSFNVILFFSTLDLRYGQRFSDHWTVQRCCSQRCWRIHQLMVCKKKIHVPKHYHFLKNNFYIVCVGFCHWWVQSRWVFQRFLIQQSCETFCHSSWPLCWVRCCHRLGSPKE